MYVFGADTDVSPYDSGSYASSTTYLTGKAVEMACDDLKKQISGPSLNSNTIDLLKRITPENVVKVLTSYKATAGQSLQDAINEEWGLGEEEIEEYINKALEKRKQDLGAPADISFEDLIKLDYKKHGD